MARRLAVVGSGIAGLYAALLATDAGADVVLLTKGALDQSNTWYAQGGISAVLAEPAPGDTVDAHIADTLRAGAGHCNEAAVRLMCTEARRDIAGLQRYGVAFDGGQAGEGTAGATYDAGGPALGLEAAHSAPRILHAGGDATGARVAGALIQAVLSRRDAGKLTILTHTLVTALVARDGQVAGVRYLQDGRPAQLDADAVLLATGGAGQLFSQTTNPAVATADGLALAVRAGAAVADLEFFQFHPTCLVSSATAHPARLDGPLLISEAVRGEGAVLLDSGGRRFMQAYHPDAELAPRDVVSRSIALHLAKLGDPTGHVYLDARGLERARGKGFLHQRFPTLTRKTLDAGIDWTRELVPVAPAAHYWMGGVTTDLNARTSVPGLYAAGEVACTGVQGANRLASNSLLEGLVFGRRAVEDFLLGTPAWGSPDGATDGLDITRGSRLSSFGGDGGLDTAFSRDALRRLMTSHAGVLRSGELLAEAASTLDRWAAVVRPDLEGAADPVACEDRNLLLAAQLLVSAALNRTESLGAHYRSDEPVETAHLSSHRPKASLLHD
ncbi:MULTISPECIES: L-aspartate oxidase [Pseudarthrobacter]|uniref:L-aspartate oxidase n=1 Tax=Pseudarthrobacter niigatensis TaxID=369935 RepID=A0AAJ1WEQ6_9MICC|nr:MULTISPECIES: L-aspartate oxidase [Pseudarthrobacter]MDQ0145090.1 L-aspartate oxidase [Pseudarthrobacter niigatensis]MDQ0264527.1 L-aspartate oxidase [Pseudarthrobacter niigatensis]QDG88737.1 L-aspartate oxidase [Pseudarthrobacter sp. NIBRBAC000502770]